MSVREGGLRAPRPVAAVSVPTATEVAPYAHLAAHARALLELSQQAARLERWGVRLAEVLLAGGRLLAAGNGGSAAEAQHLAAELVGRYRRRRQPLSAIALGADLSSLTAIANDFGWAEGLARQVLAHGRPGDVLVALSTSGASANVLEAVRAAREAGVRTWALTGAAPNPLHGLCDDALAFSGPAAVVQEIHLVAVHLICDVVDAITAGGRSRLPRSLPEAG
jgi:D-sedoheptulose 7-phosphate isomerase